MYLIVLTCNEITDCDNWREITENESYKCLFYVFKTLSFYIFT